MPTIHLEIITPEKKAYEAEVDSVVVPGSEGEFGALAMHEAFLTLVNPGELRVTKRGKTEHLAVGRGFVEVTGQFVRVLTDMALQESEIDENKVEEALERARKALLEKPTGSEAEALAASIQKSVAMLNLKRRKR
ncbi:MAG: ATP synthase F1 subunit epsilon [Candidatus Methylacidiphilales bacterium]|nr:ATP synthase F1 subunit epsilon [Candidatus Methylacidiphilales bacterium]